MATHEDPAIRDAREAVRCAQTASDLAEYLCVRLKHLDRIRNAVQPGPIVGEAI